MTTFTVFGKKYNPRQRRDPGGEGGGQWISGGSGSAATDLSKIIEPMGTPKFVFRNEQAADVYKGKAVWGEGLYTTLSQDAAAGLAIDPNSDEPQEPDYGSVVRVALDPDLKLAAIDEGSIPKVGRAPLSGEPFKKAVLGAGYDGIRIRGESANVGGDQLVIYNLRGTTKDDGDAEKKYNPRQRRDPGGEGGGQWISGGGGSSAKPSGAPKIGARIEITGGKDPSTGKPVSGTVRGTVVRVSGSQVMINAGTAKKPKWVEGSHAQAKPAKPKPKPSKPAAVSLSEKERDAVESYQGDGYREINGGLRAGKADNPQVKALDSVVARGSLSKDTTLYRGMIVEKIPKPGSIIIDKGFASTSESRKGAELFYRRAAKPRSSTGKPLPVEGKPALVRISAPAGTPAVRLSELDTDPAKLIAGEKEVLLGRDSGFVVKELKTENGMLVIDVEIHD